MHRDWSRPGVTYETIGSRIVCKLNKEKIKPGATPSLNIDYKERATFYFGDKMVMRILRPATRPVSLIVRVIIMAIARGCRTEYGHGVFVISVFQILEPPFNLVCACP